MTQYQLLWVIGLTALLTAPMGVVLYHLLARLWRAIDHLLPPRHLVSRGQRLRTVNPDAEEK